MSENIWVCHMTVERCRSITTCSLLLLGGISQAQVSNGVVLSSPLRNFHVVGPSEPVSQQEVYDVEEA
jgi:hypothetical protein